MSTHRLWRVAGVGALIVAAGASPLAAQLPTYGVGLTPTVEELQAWDLTIPPDGEGLPPGRATSVLGRAIYVERCASCHGERGDDPKYYVLAGGRGTLTTDQPVKTVGSFWQYTPPPSGATSAGRSLSMNPALSTPTRSTR